MDATAKVRALAGSASRARASASASSKATAHAPSTRGYWLLKSEPDCFSYDHLHAAPEQRTGWSGIRNYQARNFLRDSTRIGDLVLFYHSNAEPSGVAGLARIVSGPEPDPTQFDPADEHFDPKSRAEAATWIQVQVAALAKLPRFVSLATLRATPEVATMRLLEPGSRLSVLPVTEAEWDAVLRLGGLDPKEFRS